MFSSTPSGFGVGSIYGGTGSTPEPGSPGTKNGPEKKAEFANV